MRPFAVADCETLPFKKKRKITEAYVWEFWDGETRFVTYDTEEFAAYVAEYDGILYAHNGGKFDWHFLLPYLEPYDDILIINGRIAKARLGKCELRDSYNIYSESLASYKKDDFDYTILEENQRKKGSNPKKILKYLHSDCVNLYDLVSRFIEDYGLCLTQAGAAMKQWVKISGMAAPATNEEYYEKFSHFYYGGRVECIESGIIDGHFSKFDINSAYPKAMLAAHPYTDNYLEHDGFYPDSDFYEIECWSMGAFPYRDSGVLSFPRDYEMRIYYVSGWEYRAALDTNTIGDVTVIRSIKFVDHVDFTPYIEHFRDIRWKCKTEGDELGSLFAKKFMNALYGKFAANPDNYKSTMIIPADVVGGLPGTGWSYGGEFGPWALAEQPMPEERRRYYNVATGASITGYVRAMIWRALCSCTRPLYLDTDCVLCEQPGPDIEIGDLLGQWKHEGDFDKVGIAGKKLYIMRGVKNAQGEREYTTASKGAKLTNAQLWRVAAGKETVYESESPTFSVKKAQSFVVRRIRKTAKTACNPQTTA